MCSSLRRGWVVGVLILCLGRAAWAEGIKNIIILVSDGGGFNTFRAASFYQHGRPGCEVYDQAGWVKYAARTSPLAYSYGSSYSSQSSYSSPSESAESYDPASVWDPRAEYGYASALFRGYSTLKSNYTDSAAAGTAMSTGSKTSNGRINLIGSAGYGASATQAQTLAELAKAQGKSAGVVTSVQWSDATPATFGGAHNTLRAYRREIADEMLTSGTLDLIMGAGHPDYDKNGAPRRPAEKDYEPVGGSVTWQLLKAGTHASGWRLIETRAQFEALTSGAAPAKVVGVARVSGALQQERQTRDWNGDGQAEDLDARFAPPGADPLIPTVPTLATMSRGALNVLGRNAKGFFLMIEGGSVDRAAHANQPGRLIEEQIAFNQAVEAVVEWVNTRSNWQQTLVIVTADHETGLVWGINSDTIAFEPLANRGARRMPAMWFNSKQHTNSLVPLRARGQAAGLFATRIVGFDPVYGQFIDNTGIFEVMKAALTGATLEPLPRTVRVPKVSNGRSGQTSNGMNGLEEEEGTNGREGSDPSGGMNSQSGSGGMNSQGTSGGYDASNPTSDDSSNSRTGQAGRSAGGGDGPSEKED